MAKEKLTFSYDNEDDILYAFMGEYRGYTYDAIGNGIYLLKDDITGKYRGFMIMDYNYRQNSTTMY